ncbi:hypothetical protein IP92_01910 [Pseudoduganella flava]|uniref:Chemotaxis protein n=1 Tax=Pseudoduganella flava TaxID=871742 RepID=A0A562PVU8_9BURK|nr:hypothetical protein [Pseudoduganella flava]QGZ39619.1 hypothetical protein GO485_11555 [Pseudoduganella flava]TWI48518.1 hypothetical protein IP92_01910 [Pseudoduganella flava]
MTQAQAATETWEELYESFFDHGERLTDEIDRLAADVKDAKTLNRSNARMFQQMTELAERFAQRSTELAERLDAAKDVADSAGRNAAASLTAQAEQASGRLVDRLGTAAGEVDGIIGDLRSAAAFTRAWAIVCAVVAVCGVAIGAWGTYRLLHNPTTEQDQYLRTQGVLLGRMMENASKKELAMLNTLRQREEARLRKDAAPTQ